MNFDNFRNRKTIFRGNLIVETYEEEKTSSKRVRRAITTSQFMMIFQSTGSTESKKTVTPPL